MIIECADKSLPAEVDACDFSFEITCVAVPPFDGPSIERVIPVAPYRKSYGVNPERYRSYVRRDNRALFFTRNSIQLLGYVAISQSWNNYAQIDDIAVDVSARRLGIGRFAPRVKQIPPKCQILCIVLYSHSKMPPDRGPGQTRNNLYQRQRGARNLESGSRS
jgi:hypothetical protein